MLESKNNNMYKRKDDLKMSNLAEKIESVGNVNITPVGNVVGINNENASIKIFAFLEDKKRKSKNTYDAYNRYYIEFFRFAFNKGINQVTWNDILKFTYSNTLDYKEFLLKKYTPSYTNQKMFSIKALWKRLYSINHNIDMKVWDFEKEEFEESNYGSLTHEEVEKLYQFCLQRKYKPMTQKLYFEFLFVITCRKHVAQTLIWKQIKRELDIDSKQMVWVINFTGENKDKGKNIKKAITDEFYNRLLENYNNEKETSGKVFCEIYNGTYDATLKAFCQEYNINSERNIVQHSLKSSGLDFIQDVIGDINVTAQAAQHSNIQMTYKKYLNKNKKYSSQPSYALHENFNINMLKELDKDTLLGLIEKTGRETVVKLCLELKKSRG